MGINLPARLVVIKSTQTYRGQGKGYQEYTQIEIDQMMGRAGRPQFDSEGTVVIMTEKRNFKKYNDESRPELLESHLYAQLS
jgi:ATP-dependent DNA helicase HFM1/MER3